MLFYEADRESDLAGKQGRLAASRHLAVLKSLLDTAAEYAGIAGPTFRDAAAVRFRRCDP